MTREEQIRKAAFSADNNLHAQPHPVPGVAEMNKEREFWQQVRIQAAIAAMQGMLANPAYQKVQVESGEPFGYFYAMNAIMCADVLIAELKKGGQDERD